MFKKETIFFSLFILYLFLLCFLLFSNDIRIQYAIYPFEDKLIHFSAFFVGQLFVLLSGQINRWIRKAIYGFFLMLPAFTEVIQEYLPRRVCDLGDLLAAYLGIIICLGSWFLLRVLLRYFSTSLSICRQAIRDNDKER